MDCRPLEDGVGVDGSTFSDRLKEAMAIKTMRQEELAARALTDALMNYGNANLPPLHPPLSYPMLAAGASSAESGKEKNTARAEIVAFASEAAERQPLF